MALVFCTADRAAIGIARHRLTSAGSSRDRAGQGTEFGRALPHYAELRYWADPLSGLRASAPQVPLLVGCTTEEAGMFLAMDPIYERLGQAELATRLHAECGDQAFTTTGTYV